MWGPSLVSPETRLCPNSQALFRHPSHARAKMLLDQPGGRTQNLLIPCRIVVRRLAIGPTGRGPIGLVNMWSVEPERHSSLGMGPSCGRLLSCSIELIDPGVEFGTRDTPVTP
ncbi:hypothetical protein CGRA01v4_06032 [Colletotrichum graminicola]|nr:hypothetical protein CGRA01v4_06032 [Colletotrichum graminicola]